MITIAKSYELFDDECLNLMLPLNTEVKVVDELIKDMPIQFYRFYDCDGCWYMVMNYCIYFDGDIYNISQRHSIHQDGSITSHSPLNIYKTNGDESNLLSIDKELLQESLGLKYSPVSFTSINKAI